MISNLRNPVSRKPARDPKKVQILRSPRERGGGAAAPDSPLEAIFPRLWAQEDELGKLANEMAALVEEAGLAMPGGFSVDSANAGISAAGNFDPNFSHLEVKQVLAALKEATAL